MPSVDYPVNETMNFTWVGSITHIQAGGTPGYRERKK